MLRRWGFGIVVVWLLSSMLVVAQEREVTLRFRFVPKQQLTYENRMEGEMAMSTQVMGQEVSFTLIMKGQTTDVHRVEEVDKEGVATIVTTKRGRLSMEAIGLPATADLPSEQEIPPTRMRLKVDSRGKILEFKSEGETASPRSPVLQSGFQFQEIPSPVLLPEKPVRVGDSWDASTALEMAMKDRTVKLDVKGQARLLAFEKVDGRDCAVLEVTTEVPDLSDLFTMNLPNVPEGAINTRSEGQATAKVWFDIANGLIVRREETVNMTMNFSVSMPTGQSLSMSMQGIFRSEERLTKVTEAEKK